MALFWSHLAYTEEHHWRRNSAQVFAAIMIAVGGYFDHQGVLGFAFGVLLSTLGYTMWLGTPPHREHVKRYSERYSE